MTATRLVWIIWIGLALFIIGALLLHPELTNPENLEKLITENREYAFLVYTGLAFGRSFTLFPLTPFIIAGALIFPDQPFIPIGVCWVSGQIASVVHYYFPHWLGIDTWAKKKFPERYDQLHRQLEGKGFFYILFISMLPIMPGELVYYVSGVIRTPFWPFQLAIGISHAIVITIYVLLTQQLA